MTSLYYPGLDLVVCNYRTPDDLYGFLSAFHDVEREVDASLIVANVAPTPEDESVTDRWADRIDSMYGQTNHRENIGYARACNDAAAAGNRMVIGLFNADTRLRPGVLRDAYDYFLDHPDVGIIGPKQVDDDGCITSAGVFGTNSSPHLRGWKRRDSGQFDDVRHDAVSVSGSAYFVRRSVWDELTECVAYRVAAPDAVGALLPTQHYYEETFCSYHARDHGWECVYLGTTSMVHRWHKASPLGGAADRLMAESRNYFRYACDLHNIERD